MARPRKPTALHLLSGSMAHDPQRFRDRANEPKPEPGIGEPPDRLNAAAKAIWAELDAEIVPGVLTKQDRRMFGLLCVLLAQFDADPQEMTGAKLSTINSLMGQFGMTPSTRSKVPIAPPAKEANPFDKFKRSPSEEFRQK